MGAAVSATGGTGAGAGTDDGIATSAISYTGGTPAVASGGPALGSPGGSGCGPHGSPHAVTPVTVDGLHMEFEGGGLNVIPMAVPGAAGA
mgnify:CR=1 FL=1